MKYTVTLTITATQTIEVDADTDDEAIASAQDLFNFDDADITDIGIDLETPITGH